MQGLAHIFTPISRLKIYHLLTLFTVLFVLMFNLILLYPLHRSMDIPAWDESQYLGQGHAFAQGYVTLPAAIGSPLYVLSYALLALFFNPIQSIFAMSYLLGLSIPLLLFLFIQQRIRHLSLAVLLSFLFSLSFHNISDTAVIIDNTPVLRTILIYRFGLLIFLIALLLEQHNSLGAALVVTLGIFVRQEYLFIALPYLAYLCFRATNVWPDRKWFLSSMKKSLLSITTILPALLLLFLVITVPGWGNSTARAWFAFQQHYALRQVDEGLYTINPWTDYHIVINQTFPGANSLSDAFRVNTEAFVYHVIQNIMQLPSAFLAFLRPDDMFSNLPITIVITIILVIPLFCLLACYNSTFSRIFLSQLATHQRILIFTAMGFLAILPSIVVFTKSSYALPALPWIFITIALIYHSIDLVFTEQFSNEDTGHTWIVARLLRFLPFVACITIFVLVLGVPKPFELKTSQRRLYDKVITLQRILPNRMIKLAGVGIVTYASYVGYNRIAPVEILSTVYGLQAEKVGLDDIVAHYHPDAIMVSQLLRSSPNVDAATFAALDTDWVRYPIGDEQLYVAPHLAQKPVALPQGVLASPDIGVVLQAGWYDFEPASNSYWMQGEGHMWVWADTATAAIVRLQPMVINEQNSFGSTGLLTVTLNQQQLAPLKLHSGTQTELRLDLKQGFNKIQFALQGGDFVPAEHIPGYTDTRRLGIAFRTIEFVRLP